MNYKIYKVNNYVIVIDQNNNYYEEHCSKVLITKRTTVDTTYDVAFLRVESTPLAFYNIPLANILTESNVPYASVNAWETWYTTNTGDGCGGDSASDSVHIDLSEQEIKVGTYESAGESAMVLNIVNPNITRLLSISILGRGAGDSYVTLNASVTTFRVKKGESINLDADAIMNFVSGGASAIGWDTSINSGAELLILYTYLA
jgi:hypothetical protein